jgi:hypothetical protein
MYRTHSRVKAKEMIKSEKKIDEEEIDTRIWWQENVAITKLLTRSRSVSKSRTFNVKDRIGTEKRVTDEDEKQEGQREERSSSDEEVEEVKVDELTRKHRADRRQRRRGLAISAGGGSGHCRLRRAGRTNMGCTVLFVPGCTLRI